MPREPQPVHLHLQESGQVPAALQQRCLDALARIAVQLAVMEDDQAAARLKTRPRNPLTSSSRSPNMLRGGQGARA